MVSHKNPIISMGAMQTYRRESEQTNVSGGQWPRTQQAEKPYMNTYSIKKQGRTNLCGQIN